MSHFVVDTNVPIVANGKSKQASPNKAKVKRKSYKIGERLLNSFMERKIKICFETRSARNKASFLNPLNLFMGILFLLFTF